MNALLMKYKPSDKTPEQWEQIWQNSGYVFDPLRKTLEELKRELVAGRVSGEAFEVPNHYAQLVASLAKERTIDQILDLLPK